MNFRCLTEGSTFVLLAAALLLTSCSGTPDSPSTDASSEEWIALFDGESLDGWTPKIRGEQYGEDARRTFRVEDGRNRESDAVCVGAPVLDGLLDFFLAHSFVGGTFGERRPLGIGSKAQANDLAHGETRIQVRSGQLLRAQSLLETDDTILCLEGKQSAVERGTTKGKRRCYQQRGGILGIGAPCLCKVVDGTDEGECCNGKRHEMPAWLPFRVIVEILL